MGGKKMMKACTKCKQRKKKCSGGLPCDYCIKINLPHECEYKEKVRSKFATVSERYISSLKSRIMELEGELAKINSGATETVAVSAPSSNALMNPLIEPEYRLQRQTVGNGESSTSCDSRYLGMSACAQFLRKLKESLTMSGDPNGGVLSETSHSRSSASGPSKILTQDSTDDSYLQIVVKELLPSKAEANRLLDIACRMIGADYMFIEADYFKIVEELYEKVLPVTASEKVQYANELLRFVSHLALGSLFDRENPTASSLGKELHQTSISLYGQILKSYDQAAGATLIQSLLCMAYFALSQNKTTFVFTTVGAAIRTMLALGYHRKVKSKRENRVFWLCFIYDRLLAVRFGFPLMIDERDINIPVFNEAERTHKAASLDIYHFVAQVNLAKITTQVLAKIYTQNAFSFLHNCHSVLKQLKEWFDALPSELKFDYNDIKTGTVRSTFNLHINYNYSIIISTRPVLLYVFNRMMSNIGAGGPVFEQRQFELIQVLLDSCIQAAEVQSRILAKLYYDGKMANCSYLDCHYIFSATIILILAGYCQTLSDNSALYSGDVMNLFGAIEHNLRILQGLSEYNVVASDFNRQLTEFIDMMSSDEVVAVLKEEPKPEADPASFLQRLKSPNPNFPDAANNNLDQGCDVSDLGFVDLSNLVSNIDKDLESGIALNMYLDENL
ncbi:LAME_0C00408g1_1 [Lachancea meyersii CBS 8951]|uniref:LAME_0C00408g1_1 n=1 Tax=Lachancea meyersii CBS 8951 TaxID=1266667 RepID=A0A1G4IYP8_9SACH|nr:LAME_0C00408g1_1 [Lachancea meyersii CBS 8951]